MSVLWAKRGWMSGGTFVPHQLFTSGAQGAWYDPSDRSTLFQDAAGTTPVTAVEQPVRLMLDRSKGLVLGSELGDPALLDKRAGTDGTVSRAGGVITFTNATAGLSNGISELISGLTIGRTYIFRGQIRFVSGPAPFISLRDSSGGGGSTLLASSGNSSTTFAERVLYWVATATSVYLTYQASLGSVFEVLEAAHSFRELPGNHALAPNDASRPVLRARYNLLTFSEQFDNAGWTQSNTTVTANAGVAPDGTTTADNLIATSAAGNHQATQSATTAATAITFSVYAKQNGYSWVALGLTDSGSTVRVTYFDLANGLVGTVASGVTASIADVGNGWYRCVATVATALAGSNTARVYVTNADAVTSFTGDDTSGILIWGAQLLTAADQSATGGVYQRVGAATDYDTSNPVWRPYLAFDGSDDSFSTSSIDFSGTDEMTVFAGVTKLSDATTGTLIDQNGIAATAAFMLRAPSGANPNYAFFSGGSISFGGAIATTYAAPITNVLTGIGDISGDVATLRVNGAQIATNTGNQGTGNYSNLPIYIGRRQGSDLALNGRIYSLAVLGRTATAAELGAMEAWVAGKTGVNLP